MVVLLPLRDLSILILNVLNSELDLEVPGVEAVI